jgi:hypothetical protein
VRLTKSEMLKPKFAIVKVQGKRRGMIRVFTKEIRGGGLESRWTCWRLFFSRGTSINQAVEQGGLGAKNVISKQAGFQLQILRQKSSIQEKSSKCHPGKERNWPSYQDNLRPQFEHLTSSTMRCSAIRCHWRIMVAYFCGEDPRWKLQLFNA